MGGQKFRHGNILFKLSTPGQGIYQDVVHAHKSNSNELRAMAAVGRCQVARLLYDRVQHRINSFGLGADASYESLMCGASSRSRGVCHGLEPAAGFAAPIFFC